MARHVPHALAVLAAVLGIMLVDRGAASASTVRHVAPGGSGPSFPECEGGTEAAPWRRVTEAMRCLRPGDTLVVRGGTYTERVSANDVAGTRNQPITIQGAPGERPVIRGFVRLQDPDNVTVRGLNVTNDGRRYGSGQYLVKMRGGDGWSWEDSEIWNATSYSAFRVEPNVPQNRGPRNWRIAGNCIHTTHATHEPGSDHNIYVDTGPNSSNGLVERNVLFHAPNGANIKLGPGAISSSYSRDVTVRFNTMWAALQNVLANGRTRDINVHRNLLGGVDRFSHERWLPNVLGYELTGSNNRASHNLGHGTRYFIHNRHAGGGWRGGGGNRHPVNPVLSGTSSCGQFRPSNSGARTFGHLAAEAVPRTKDLACPAATRTGFPDVTTGHAHARGVACVTGSWGVAHGRTDGTYRPASTVSRAQMATFVANLVLNSGGTLPEAPSSRRFRDLGTTPHAENIERLAAAGIVSGTAPRSYSPAAPVSRAQMATFLSEAYRYRTGRTLPRVSDHFPDDDGNVHEVAIDRIAAAGLTAGLGDGGFGPHQRVARAPMATFVARALDRFVEDGVSDGI